MRSAPFACALLLLGSSCAEDDDDARPRYTARVGDATIEVSNLGADDQRRICASFDAYVGTHVSFEALAYVACLPPAIVLGGTPQGCEQQLDDCMALFPEPIEVEARLSDEQLCFSSLAQCSASVAALEGCINVNLDLALDIIDNWSCSGVVDDDQREAAARAMDTASVCADISAACNDFATVAGPD